MQLVLSAKHSDHNSSAEVSKKVPVENVSNRILGAYKEFKQAGDCYTLGHVNSLPAKS